MFLSISVTHLKPSRYKNTSYPQNTIKRESKHLKLKKISRERHVLRSTCSSWFGVSGGGENTSFATSKLGRYVWLLLICIWVRDGIFLSWPTHVDRVCKIFSKLVYIKCAFCYLYVESRRMLLKYCYGCLYNAYTWKNQVYLSMITLFCELWVVWSLWICWESGFAYAICGSLSMCCLITKKKKLYENKKALCLACCHFLHVSMQTNYLF